MQLKDIQPYIIYRTVVGSTAQGLAVPTSDCDYRGIYIAPFDVFASLSGAPDEIESKVPDECIWEIGKFVRMALKANPTALEVLYTPASCRTTETDFGLYVLGHRHAFLSKRLHATYSGYAASQFHKIEQDIRTGGEIRWKHAMHLIRLLLAGTVALQEGAVPVDMSKWRDELVGIRLGQWTWDQVNNWQKQLRGALDDAYATTRIPDAPDDALINQLLLEARHLSVAY